MNHDDSRKADGVLAVFSAVGRPSDTVLLTADGPVSRGELVACVEKVVHDLSNAGIGADDRVAICCAGRLSAVVALLAVTECAVAAPLNPAITETEFADAFTRLNVSMLLLDGSHPAAVAAADRRQLPTLGVSSDPWTSDTFSDTDNDADSDAKASADARSTDTVSRDVDAVVLLLQTSGTTGEPKLIPLRHGQIIASATNIAATLQLAGNDLGLAVMPYFHIHGIMTSLFAPLMANSPILLPDPVDPAAFPDWIERFRPTWYSAVPTMHRAFLTAWESRSNPSLTSSLRFVRSSSAPLPNPLHDALIREFDAPVIEAYGMTEACHQIASGTTAPDERRRGSVGRVRGLEVRIVDIDSHAVSGAGTMGEIQLRGDTIGRGMATESEGGWFGTGDLGHLDDDDFLFLDGRIKELVNRGGEKVNPHEVDRVLAICPAVSEALSFGVPHPTLGEDLQAAVVVALGKTTDEAGLRAHCFEHLAGFKVPTRIVILERLPRSASGKLVRSAVAHAAAAVQNSEAEPATPLEQQVALFFADVLSLDTVRASDNFFALGGDSLSAARVAVRVGEVLLVPLSPVALFRHPTVQDYAREIDRLSIDIFERPLNELLLEKPA